MRLMRLELRAFGAFTDRTIDLSQGSEGLHVVYGANEAGKTTALNAIRRFLYGFPHQSDYDFLHKSADMRIGALLRRTEGDELFCLRRKGRKNTLLSESGQALDDAVLAPYLGGIDEELFATMFGIGYDSLVEGGQDILAARGDIGSSVFAASAGIAGVRDILRELGEEAANLFAPRAQNPAINDAVRRYELARRTVREKSLPERKWHELNTELDALTARRRELVEA